jgi:hypothetical protein
MKHTVINHVKRAGIALAAVAACAALGTGTAQAAQFDSADIALDNAGNLQCRFRESGLGAFALISYSCGAEAVGVVSGCFVKNKLVANIPLTTSYFKDVSNQGEEGEAETILSKNNGAIGATITVEVPESHGGEACTEPAESGPVAVRWCNASLVDTTNAITGATAGVLTAVVARTGTVFPDVPTCAEILAAPPTDGGGE